MTSSQKFRQIPSIDASTREAVIRMARNLGDDPYLLKDRSREIAVASSRTPDEYRQALRMIEVAMNIAPWETDFLNTLGIAQYKNGLFSQTVATLEAEALIGG